MFTKGRYINLTEGPGPEADGSEVKFSLDSQDVQLSRKPMGWIWPRKVVFRREGEECRKHLIDFGPLLQVFLSGVSLLLAALEVLKRYLSRREDLNGGQFQGSV